MSFFECRAPACAASSGSVDLIVRPSRKDLGEFSVARALSADRIEQAKRDWKDGRFAMVDGDEEFIPLPD